MIRIRYSATPSIEIEIGGTTADFVALREALRSVSSDEVEFPVDAQFDPAPYTQALAGLRLQKTSDLLSISVRESTLCIAGRPDLLELFGENLPYDVEESSSSGPYHIHFDGIGREEYVAEDSLDVVLTLKD